MARRTTALLLALVAACGGGGDHHSAPADDAAVAEADPALPGLGHGDPGLMQRLRAALRAKGPAYRPHTRHLEADGSPTYVNRLILETSPYLLQHAHNPVNWFPWGDEAFARARRDGKPVLLSIGYSTCHWCHVMERESFENVAIARYINQHYIPIKVDREERPDVDGVYMTAVQMLTGGGGWPMTLVLTPDREPFFGATYIPGRDGERGARAGLLTILRQLDGEYRTHRDTVVARARQISRGIQAASTPRPPGNLPDAAVIQRVERAAAASFDPVWGGFGAAPKFPRPAMLELLLRYHRRTGDARALQMVARTLDKMAAGGIYDQIGGGFHRYSTDARWLVPHFEKMLYDNAQLARLYVDAYQASGRAAFGRIARETLEYVRREMTAPSGAFYSATDADSPAPSGHDEEGYFFTWTPAELDDALGPGDARIARELFAVTDAGNFDGRNILSRPRTDAEVAAALKLSPAALRRAIPRLRARLLEVRARRPRPHRDDKIVTSYNGLMISALARAGLVLGDASYTRRAARAADFLLGHLRGDGGRLLRSFRDSRASDAGYLDDYAFLIAGLLDLFEATSDPARLEQAVALQKILDRHFWDGQRGGYFLTSDDQERLLARDKPAYDGAVPSGNSVALQNLLHLAEITGDDDYRHRAERGFAAFSGELSAGPDGSPAMLSALEAYLDRPLEVFVVRPDAAADAAPLLSVFRRTYLPNRVFALVTDGPALAALAARLPALDGKHALHGRATAFVCERGSCQIPTSDPRVFAKQLARVAPLAGPVGKD